MANKKELWYTLEEARKIVNGDRDITHNIHLEAKVKNDISKENFYKRVQELEKLGDNGHILPTYKPKTIKKNIDGKSMKLINLTMVDDLINYYGEKEHGISQYTRFQKYKENIEKYNNGYYKNSLLSNEEQKVINKYLKSNFRDTSNAVQRAYDFLINIRNERDDSRHLYKDIHKAFINKTWGEGTNRKKKAEEIFQHDTRQKAYISQENMERFVEAEGASILNSFAHSKAQIRKELSFALAIDLSKEKKIERELNGTGYYDLVIENISDQLYKNHKEDIVEIRKTIAFAKETFDEVFYSQRSINGELRYINKIIMKNF